MLSFTLFFNIQTRLFYIRQSFDITIVIKAKKNFSAIVIRKGALLFLKMYL